MKKPHKQAELIKAWADGAEIQWRDKDSDSDRAWRDTNDPWFWNGINMEFRIKPEPKPDFYRYLRITEDCHNYDIKFAFKHDSHIKLTFDGETNKLKSAEVLE